MKKLLSLLVAMAGLAGSASAQCAYNNTQTGVTLSPPTAVGVATTMSTCVSGGQFIRISGLTAGASYTVSTCGDTDFDTQLTLYPAGGGSVIGYNDDFCGSQSSVTFTATSANSSIDVLVDRYNCVSNSLCMTVNMTLVSVPAVDPCTQITPITCGAGQSFTLAGSGFGYNPGACGFSTPGAERIYSFTAASSGAYTLNVTSASGGYVDYFIKDAAAGCSSTGWTCIDDINAATSVPFNVVAGTTYYLLVDGEGTGSRSQTFNIGCIAPPNPCNSIDSLSCGISKTFSLQGAGGGWNVTACGFSTPGAEQIYQFTAPLTGTYTLNVTSATGGYVDYFFKSVSAGCGSTGWTCIDDVNGAVNTNFTLTAGTYYILVDAEDTGAKTQSFNISCPAPPPSNDGCGTPILVSCGSTVSGSTLNATPDNAPSCNGFAVGTGGGVWYKVIGTGSLITISTCDPATNYDTKLHVYEGSCTNLLCVTADDDGCDSPVLASTVTFCSVQGTVYYVLVNGFGTSTGDFVLRVDCTPPTLVIDPIADRCHDDASVTLSANIPGGTFTVNGVVATSFDPATAPDGPSTITYSVCGLSASITANVTPTPSNDLCGNATAINCGDVITGSTVCATADVAPTCGTTDGSGGGVWYAFTGNGNSVTASLCQGSDFDTKIRVFTGTCGALVCQTGVDDACGLQSTVSWCAEPGVVYYILVHGFSTSEGNFTLALTCNASAPVIASCAAPQVGSLDSACAFVVPDYTGFVGASDDCGVTSVTQSPAPGSVLSGAGVNTISFTVSDAGGNTATCSTTLTLEDNTAPLAVCNSYTAYLDATGFVQVEPLDLVTASTDNCGIDTATGNCSFFCSDLGANPRQITVIDINGNTSTCTATVTVVDTTAPQAVCTDIVVVLDAVGSAVIVAEDLDGGSADNCSISTISASATVFGCASLGVNSVTLTVTDQSGNTSTCVSTVTVIDDIAPTAICQNGTVYLDANGQGSIAAEDIDGGSTDNCNIASLGLSNGSFTCANVGANNSVILTVTDQSGNSSTCTATVTVIDNVAPVAICQNVTVQLDASGNGSTTASAIDNGSNDACGIASISANPTAFTCANVGPNTVTLTVTDVNGNVSTCTATATVVDNVAPVAICQNVTVTLDDNGNGGIVAAQLNGGSNDACGIASLSASATSFGCSNLGANTVTLTVTDVNGNSSTCTATVTVVEGHFVEITCPADITTTCETGNGGAYVTWATPSAIAFNSCADPCPVNTCIPGFTFLGEYNGHRYYVKNSGVNWNQANTAAQAIGGYLVTINNAAENTWLRNNLGGNNCGGGTFWTGYNDVATEGSFAWANGEVSSYTNWASGEPNNDGGSNCCGNGNLTAGDYGVLQQGDGKWYDRRGCNSYGYIVELNCGNAYTITQIAGPAPGSLFPQGSTTVTYVAADNYGSTDTCSFTVTVEEVFEVLCPGDITIPCQSGNNCGGSYGSNQNGATISWNAPTVLWETCAGNVCGNTCISGFDYLGTYGGKRYYVSNGSSTWNSARSAALAAGGSLATIDDAAENTWLNNQISGSSSYWIGLNDAGTEGSFAWTSGAGSTYRSWASGEPNNGGNGGNQDFVSFNASNGLWNDRNSGDCYKYIMEYSCNSYSIAQTAGPANGSFQAPGTYTVAYTATTTTGLVATCSFDITVEACPLQYCNVSGNSCYEWIRQVNLCNLDNWSGSNGGYEDFTQYSATVNRGSSYTINLRPGFSGSSRNEYWAVYADWNQDGDFSDSGELEYTGNGNGLKTGSISVPSSAVNGNTRMRVIMRYGCAPSGPCSSVGNGEVEDYTLTVVGAGVRAAAQANGTSESEVGAESATAPVVAEAASALLGIYPVPTQHDLHLNYRAVADGEVTVQVLALDGRIVMESKHQVSVNDNTITLDVSNLPMASYQVTISNGSESFTEKFVKQ